METLCRQLGERAKWRELLCYSQKQYRCPSSDGNAEEGNDKDGAEWNIRGHGGHDGLENIKIDAIVIKIRDVSMKMKALRSKRSRLSTVKKQ